MKARSFKTDDFIEWYLAARFCTTSWCQLMDQCSNWPSHTKGTNQCQHYLFCQNYCPHQHLNDHLQGNAHLSEYTPLYGMGTSSFLLAVGLLDNGNNYLLLVKSLDVISQESNNYARSSPDLHLTQSFSIDLNFTQPSLHTWRVIHLSFTWPNIPLIWTSPVPTFTQPSLQLTFTFTRPDLHMAWYSPDLTHLTQTSSYLTFTNTSLNPTFTWNDLHPMFNYLIFTQFQLHLTYPSPHLHFTWPPSNLHLAQPSLD